MYIFLQDFRISASSAMFLKAYFTISHVSVDIYLKEISITSCFNLKYLGNFVRIFTPFILSAYIRELHTWYHNFRSLFLKSFSVGNVNMVKLIIKIVPKQALICVKFSECVKLKNC